MAPTPRLITVDPTGALGRIVRAAIDMIDQSVVFIESANGSDALAELKRGGATLLVTAVELDDEMQGYQLAALARREHPNMGVVVLADYDDAPLDEGLLADAPFVYLHRGVDTAAFVRVLVAALRAADLASAARPPPASAAAPVDLGPVPTLDQDAARVVIDALLTDVGAMAIVLASRAGDVQLERGAVGYLDRERLTSALMPMTGTTLQMGDLVGGRTNTLHFYDGETYDIFVLSVGLHHFLCLIFDGTAGNRQFGAVNRFGRRAAEDLIALLGASAFIIQQPAQQPEPRQRRARRSEPAPEADFAPIVRPEIKVKEPEPLKLEPIEDLDLSIFDQLEKLDDTDAENLFDPDKLAEIASESRKKDGPIGFDQAQALGIMPGLDN